MLYPPGFIVVLSRQNSVACIVVATVRVNYCLFALRLHPDWGSPVTVWCMCASVWRKSAGGSAKLEPEIEDCR